LAGRRTAAPRRERWCATGIRPVLLLGQLGLVFLVVLGDNRWGPGLVVRGAEVLASGWLGRVVGVGRAAAWGLEGLGRLGHGCSFLAGCPAARKERIPEPISSFRNARISARLTRGRRDSRVRFGQTSSGRYLKVVYVPDEDRDSVFVITAYDLRGKELKAFRRRKRRKKR
jgi:hypothetical protein